MNYRRLLLPVLLLSALAGGLRAGDETEVVPVKKRQATLAMAQGILGQTIVEISENAADPFHSTSYAMAAAPALHAPVEQPGKPAGPHQGLLAAIANGLKPAGYFVLGGQPTLLFGSKRVRAGGTLLVNYEGTEYPLEFTAISRTTFTIRLNHEEYTRPIK